MNKNTIFLQLQTHNKTIATFIIFPQLNSLPNPSDD